MPAANVLVRLPGCVGPSKPWLHADASGTKILCVGPVFGWFIIYSDGLEFPNDIIFAHKISFNLITVQIYTSLESM